MSNLRLSEHMSTKYSNSSHIATRNLINHADTNFHNTRARSVIYNRKAPQTGFPNIGPLIVIASLADLIRGHEDPLMPRTPN